MAAADRFNKKAAKQKKKKIVVEPVSTFFYTAYKTMLFEQNKNYIQSYQQVNSNSNTQSAFGGGEANIKKIEASTVTSKISPFKVSGKGAELMAQQELSDRERDIEEEKEIEQEKGTIYKKAVDPIGG